MLTARQLMIAISRRSGGTRLPASPVSSLVSHRVLSSSSTAWAVGDSNSSGNSSSPASRRSGGAPSRPRNEDPWDIQNLESFAFDDTTSYGHWVLEKKREKLDLLRSVERDRELLMKQRKPFNPPSPSTHPLKFTSVISLTSEDTFMDPTLAQNRKRVLTVPIAHLPLKDDDAIHRFKLLAGPRWVPPESAIEPRMEAEETTKEGSAADHGYFKMSEQRFPEGNMNRKWLSDTLDRLVEEANSSTSSIATSIPVDIRHVVSRQQKRRGRDLGGQVWSRRQARNQHGVVGGVKGFPAEWMPSPPAQALPRSFSTRSFGGLHRVVPSAKRTVRTFSSSSRQSYADSTNDAGSALNTSELLAGNKQALQESSSSSSVGTANRRSNPFGELRESFERHPTSGTLTRTPLENWTSRFDHIVGSTGNQYSGRSFQVRREDVSGALRQLNASLGRNKIKKELRLGEFYEKPSERRIRLKRERHRRRFQEMVRKKVQLVQILRSRS